MDVVEVARVSYAGLEISKVDDRPELGDDTTKKRAPPPPKTGCLGAPRPIASSGLQLAQAPILRFTALFIFITTNFKRSPKPGLYLSSDNSGVRECDFASFHHQDTDSDAGARDLYPN
jgi:hypothetical protein